MQEKSAAGSLGLWCHICAGGTGYLQPVCGPHEAILDGAWSASMFSASCRFAAMFASKHAIQTILQSVPRGLPVHPGISSLM